MDKDKKELFTSYRWHEDVGAVMVKEEDMTEEMKRRRKELTSKEGRKKSKKEFDKILRERGMK